MYTFAICYLTRKGAVLRRFFTVSDPLHAVAVARHINGGRNLPKRAWLHPCFG
jgi:hypothetical protein